MLRHLRLARARGSLVAPNSPVQDLALDLLHLHDDGLAQQQRLDLVKASLSSQLVNGEKAKAFWPEFFIQDPYEAAVDEHGEFDPDLVDPQAVEWGVPSPDEDAKMSAWIAQAESGAASFSGAEFELGGGTDAPW